MTALGASPSERRNNQSIEEFGASRTAPSSHARRLTPASAQRLTIAAPTHHHSSPRIKKSESTNGNCAEAARQRERLCSLRKKAPPVQKTPGAKKRGRTRLMCKSEKEGSLNALLPRKRRAAVLQKRRARLSSCTACGSTEKAPCARLRRISEPRALHAPEGKDAPPLPRNADAAPFRCFCRRRRPRCRQ